MGRTALMLACFNGRKNVVKLLLENSDIDLNARPNHGRTAFGMACHRGHKEVVELLLENSDIEVNGAA